MDGLAPELRTRIIDTLSLLDVVPEDIDPDARLAGGGPGFDSIDVLELVLMLEKEYGVKIDSKEAGSTPSPRCAPRRILSGKTG